MKTKKSNTNNSKKVMDDFAITLFNSLKSNGYLFPKTTKDVESFDELYGNTEIETPAFLNPNVKNVDVNLSDLNFKMAAFTPKSSPSFNLSSDMNDGSVDNKNDKKDV